MSWENILSNILCWLVLSICILTTVLFAKSKKKLQFLLIGLFVFFGLFDVLWVEFLALRPDRLGLLVDARGVLVPAMNKNIWHSKTSVCYEISRHGFEGNTWSFFGPSFLCSGCAKTQKSVMESNSSGGKDKNKLLPAAKPSGLRTVRVVVVGGEQFDDQLPDLLLSWSPTLNFLWGGIHPWLAVFLILFKHFFYFL